MPSGDAKNKLARGLFKNCSTIIYLIVEVNMLAFRSKRALLTSYISKYFCESANYAGR